MMLKERPNHTAGNAYRMYMFERPLLSGGAARKDMNGKALS